MNHFLLLEMQEWIINSDKHEFDDICALRYYTDYWIDVASFNLNLTAKKSTKINVSDSIKEYSKIPNMMHPISTDRHFN